MVGWLNQLSETEYYGQNFEIVVKKGYFEPKPFQKHIIDAPLCGTALQCVSDVS